MCACVWILSLAYTIDNLAVLCIANRVMNIHIISSTEELVVIEVGRIVEPESPGGRAARRPDQSPMADDVSGQKYEQAHTRQHSHYIFFLND